MYVPKALKFVILKAQNHYLYNGKYFKKRPLFQQKRAFFFTHFLIIFFNFSELTMIEQTKKLRLDELQVDSFVTNTVQTPKTIIGGISIGGNCQDSEGPWCDGGSRFPCGGGSIPEPVSYENHIDCMVYSNYCTDLRYEWCRDQQSVPSCPTGLFEC